MLAQIDQQEIVELAIAPICIPSFKIGETAVARFLADFFRARGYDGDLQEVELGRRWAGPAASLM